MWAYAASAQVVTFLERLSPTQRRQLRLALDRMAEHLPSDAAVAFADASGRQMRTCRDGEFEFLFWRDDAMQELRIVEVEFIRR